jgi:hypothetical protein
MPNPEKFRLFTLKQFAELIREGEVAGPSVTFLDTLLSPLLAV